VKNQILFRSFFVLMVAGQVALVRAGADASREVFVRFRPRSAALGLTSFRQAQLVWTSTLVPGLRRYRLPEGVDRGSWMLTAEVREDLYYIEPNYVVYRDLRREVRPEPESAPAPWERRGGTSLVATLAEWVDDPYLSAQWALTTRVGLHPDEAWKVTRGQPTVRVAVIDTGVQTDHPDLRENLVPGWDVIAHSPRISDHHGHGTHVSGIIAARSGNGTGIEGVAGRASIVPLRAVPDQGDEADANIIEALEKAVELGARVANCSFGKKESSQAVADVITAAGEKGLLVVVASGNDGDDLNVHPHFPASFGTPNMVVVASYDKRGNLASTSNTGVGKVDLAAPGVKIYSTYNDGEYRYLSGTSMASPQVAGVAALLLSVRPGLSPADLKRLLVESVDKRPAFLGKVTAEGAVDASRALTAALANP
jgi:thermitase